MEVRLGLLSLDPALHMLSMSLEDERSDSDACDREHSKPFSVDFDAQALESSEGVQFFCRKCSCVSWKCRPWTGVRYQSISMETAVAHLLELKLSFW